MFYSDLPEDIINLIPSYLPFEWLYMNRELSRDYFRLYLLQVVENRENFEFYRQAIEDRSLELLKDLISSTNIKEDLWKKVMIISLRNGGFGLDYLLGMNYFLEITEDLSYYFNGSYRGDSWKLFQICKFPSMSDKDKFLYYILFHFEDCERFFSCYLPSVSDGERILFIWNLSYSMNGIDFYTEKAKRIIPYLSNLAQIREDLKDPGDAEDTFIRWIVEDRFIFHPLIIILILLSAVVMVIRISIRNIFRL